MNSSDVSKCEVIEVAFEAANKHEVPANQDKNLKDRICDKPCHLKNKVYSF